MTTREIENYLHDNVWNIIKMEMWAQSQIVFGIRFDSLFLRIEQEIPSINALVHFLDVEN